jgi:hypothetical protein
MHLYKPNPICGPITYKMGKVFAMLTTNLARAGLALYALPLCLPALYRLPPACRWFDSNHSLQSILMACRLPCPCRFACPACRFHGLPCLPLAHGLPAAAPPTVAPWIANKKALGHCMGEPMQPPRAFRFHG